MGEFVANSEGLLAAPMFRHKKTASSANPGPLKQDSAQAALINTPTQTRQSTDQQGKKSSGNGEQISAGMDVSGKEILVFQDGSIYQGQTQDNQPHGTGVWSSIDGEVYEGE